MELDDVPADVKFVLTIELDRLFRAVDCSPTCHACESDIYVGEDFTLVSFEGNDQMVCSEHGLADLKKRKEIEEKERLERLAYRYGGYSRPSVRGY